MLFIGHDSFCTSCVQNVHLTSGYIHSNFIHVEYCISTIDDYILNSVHTVCPSLTLPPSYSYRPPVLQALTASLLKLEVLQETTLRLMEIMDEQNHVPSASDAT